MIFYGGCGKKGQGDVYCGECSHGMTTVNLINVNTKTINVFRRIPRTTCEILLLSLVCILLMTSHGRTKPAPPTKQDQEPIWSINFEHSPTDSEFLKHPRLGLAPGEGVEESTALRTEYVGYDRGSKRVIRIIDLPEKMDAATLNFDVKFGQSFQFVRGGKLHGFGPKRRITGGREMKPDGWSARIMFKSKGRVNTYTYCQNKDSKYGVGGKKLQNFRFERNQYYSISLYVRLNDPEKTNGVSMIYVNGTPVVKDDNIQFRAVEGEKTLIQKFLFSTFHGGSNPGWAPKREDGSYATVTAYFDNFSVHPGKYIRDH